MDSFAIKSKQQSSTQSLTNTTNTSPISNDHQTQSSSSCCLPLDHNQQHSTNHFNPPSSSNFLQSFNTTNILVERAQEATQDLFVGENNNSQVTQNSSSIVSSSNTVLPASLKEIQHFQQIVSERLRQLEQLIERFKVIVENVLPPPTTTASSSTDLVEQHCTVSNSSSSSKSLPATPLPNTTPTTLTNQKSSKQPTLKNLANQTMADKVEDLRSVLADIDNHLSVLKEIEQRNNNICETFSKEIRSRDEALLERMKQINQMNHEMATLQARIQHLALKNTQLESEIKYLKTASSFTNTETSSTPVLNDLERIQPTCVDSLSSIMVSAEQSQPPPPSQDILNSTVLQAKLFNSSNSMLAPDPASVGGKLPIDKMAAMNKTGTGKNVQKQLQQQSKSKPIQRPSSLTVTATSLADGQDDHSHQSQISPSALSKSSVRCKRFIDPEANIEASPETSGLSNDEFDRSNQSSTTPIPATNSTPTPLLSQVFANPNNQQQHAAIYHDLMVQYRKIEQLIQQSRLYKINQDPSLDIETTPLLNQDGYTDTTDISIETSDTVPEATKTTATTNIESDSVKTTTIKTNDSGISDVATNGNVLDGDLINGDSITEPNTPATAIFTNTTAVGGSGHVEPFGKMETSDNAACSTPGTTTVDMLIDNNDVVATSIKAYEHFVKMQHDLEILMKKENDYRSKIQVLEQENQRLAQQVKDDEFNLSDVQYELDILKHNYELEIESFTTAINEREGLIEKLQQKMQNLKARYLRLDEKIKQANKTEIELNANIEELQGRLEYEQLQKKTLIDSRVSELENKFKQQEVDNQLEVNNLKTDLVCQESICKELQTKIDELENSLKNLASAESEDEFVYYKSQIDGLVAELDKEKQERQRIQEQYEQNIRAKDKFVEQQKELLKKEKDSLTREKNEYEQRFKKMSTKLKSKEQQIKQLQDKISMLNDKFKSSNKPASTSSTTSDDPDTRTAKQTTKSEEELLAELALNELKLNEMSGQLDDYEERFRNVQQSLQAERSRRRQLETFYLNTLNNLHGSYDSSINGGYYSNADFMSNIVSNSSDALTADMENLANNKMDNYYWHGQDDFAASSMLNRRESASSLALFMDEWSTSGHPHHHSQHPIHHQNQHQQHGALSGNHQQQSNMESGNYFQQCKRWLRRQKNILLCGHFKARIGRIFLLAYFIWIHYVAVIYLMDDGSRSSSITRASIIQQHKTDSDSGLIMEENSMSDIKSYG